jgi:hypothetical protein
MRTALDDVETTRVDVTDESITAVLADGRTVSVPLWWSWRLEAATPAERANYEIYEGGAFHWPDVDEDLSVEGMIFGTPAPLPRPDVFRYLVRPPAFARLKRKLERLSREQHQHRE